MSGWIWRVWAGLGRKGRCYKCRRPIRWETTDRGRQIPLEADAQPLRTETETATGARFNIFAGDALHSKTCPARPKNR